MRCAQYILLLMFCGLGQHSGYSNLLWASPGCGIYHLPLSSAEIKESVALYMQALNACCRMKFANFFFNCLPVWGQGSMASIATVDGPLFKSW